MNEYTGQRILTVSQFNALSKTILENEPLLRGVTLTGELSGVKKYPSGHIYFTLKDENAALSCVMFSSSAASLKFIPTEGMKVRIKGTATVYERDGRYQFIVRSMESDGAGIYGANSGAVCIECLGNFDKGADVMTDAQKNAISEIVSLRASKKTPYFDVAIDKRH